jgi:tetratricopeptide (TPR) repeat protein
LTLLDRTWPRFAVFALACGLYAGTLANELVYDDLKLIPHNPLMRDPWDVRALLMGRYWGEVLHSLHYRPLTVWTLALNYWTNQVLGLDGDQVVGFHLLNALLHASASCLLCLLCTRLGLPLATGLTTALLFAAHPIHTEAVTFITGRAEPLALVCGFFFLLFHHKNHWPLAGAAYFLALLSKESALAFLPAAMWMDACFKGLKKSDWKAPSAYGAVLAAWLLLRAAALGSMEAPISALDNPLTSASLGQRLCTAASVQLTYLRLQALPVRLSSDYSYNQIPLVDSPLDAGAAGFLAAVVLAGLATWALRRDHPIVPFAIGAYAILAAPTSNFLFLVPTIMGERLAYAPSAFLCLLLGWSLGRLAPKVGKPVWVAAGLLVLACAVLTLERNSTWSSAELFYRAQYRSAPRSARAHLGMGKMHSEAGQLDSALFYYRGALEIFPPYALAWYNLGLAQTLKKEWDAALSSYSQAIALEPGYARAWYNLGGVYLQKGQLARALWAFEQLLSLDPDHADAWNSLGAVRWRQGNFRAAAQAFAQALALEPDHAEARRNLELLREKTGAKY